MAGLIVQCLTSTIGRVPLDPRLAKCLESGVNFTEEYADTDANAALTTVVQSLVTRIQS